MFVDELHYMNINELFPDCLWFDTSDPQLYRWNYHEWPSTTCPTSQPLLRHDMRIHERHCSGSYRWQKLAMHMHLCILPSSPTSVFVQATRLKNWDRSWDRDWKGLTSSAESWTLRTAIIPFWVWFLRYLIWFQRLCEWYFRRYHLDVIWFKFETFWNRCCFRCQGQMTRQSLAEALSIIFRVGS